MFFYLKILFHNPYKKIIKNKLSKYKISKQNNPIPLPQ